MTEKLRQDLANIVGEDNIFTSPAELAVHASGPCSWPERADWPLAVVRPLYRSQLKRLIEYCAAHKLPLRCRGAGLMPKNCAFYANALVLLGTGLNSILELDEISGLVYAQAGVTAGQLNRELAKYALFFPPAFSAHSQATLGGLFAANDAICSRKYGSLNAWLDAITIFDGTGREHHFYARNSQPGKVDAALPLAGLFCGSCGSCGVIEAVKIKVFPLPENRLELYASFEDDLQAARAACSLLAAKFLPDRLDIVGKKTAQNFFKRDQAFLHIVLTGKNEETRQAAEYIKGLAPLADSPGARIMENPEPAIFPEDFFSFWTGALLKDKKQGLAASLALPAARLADCLKSLDNMAADARLEYAFAGHADIARLDFVFYGENSEALRTLPQYLAAMELMLNDRLESEADAWLTREEWQKSHNREADISKNIKQIFDPHGILSAH